MKTASHDRSRRLAVLALVPVLSLACGDSAPIAVTPSSDASASAGSDGGSHTNDATLQPDARASDVAADAPEPATGADGPGMDLDDAPGAAVDGPSMDGSASDTATGVLRADLLPKHPCGAHSQSCCPGNVCNDGGCCVAGESCVAAGRPPAAGSALTCQDGSFHSTDGMACGGLMHPCCPGRNGCTAANVRCTMGTCTPCGGHGQECCDTFDFKGALRCGRGLACRPDPEQHPLCLPCGGDGQPCCPGADLCRSGLACAEASAGQRICQGCGAPGTACCPGTACQDGATCLGAVNRQGGSCAPCGGQGQPCCGGHCGAGLRCEGSCEPCGGPGQRCCIWEAACAGGLACSTSAPQDGSCR